MALPVRYRRSAIDDLAEIEAYVALDSPVAAEALTSRLLDVCDLIGDQPLMGRERVDLRPGIRSHAVSRYVVFDTVQPDAASILRVISAYRDTTSDTFPDPDT